MEPNEAIGKTTKVGCLNIRRGLYKKDAEILDIATKEDLDILFLTEADVKNINSKKPPQLDREYTTVCPLKQSKDKTRILALVKRGLKFKVRTDLMSGEISSIWIDVELENKKKARFGAFYREFDDLKGQSDSTSMKEQYRRFDIYLEQLEIANEEDNCTVVSLGDFNLDENKWSQQDYVNKKMSQKWLELLEYLGMTRPYFGNTFYKIDKYGKVTLSAIDHACINKKEKLLCHHTKQSSFSDHKAIIMHLNLDKSVEMTRQEVYARSLTSIRRNPTKFKWRLSQIPWEELAKMEDVDDCVKFWKENVLNVLDSMAPYKKRTVTRRPKQALSEETLQQIQKRDSLQRKIELKNGDKNLSKEYRKQRNLVRRMIYQEQMQAMTNHIQESGRKQVWRIVNNMTKPQAESGKLKIEIEGEETEDEKKIADSFNNFFLEKVDKLDQRIDRTQAINPTEKLAEAKRAKDVKEKLVLKTVQYNKVKKVIENLKAKTSHGNDELSAELLKIGGDVLHVPLTYIINKSIVDKKFPKYWKEAVIKPIWKGKGSKNELKYYRPIALLCLPGMVLECIVQEQLTKHLEENNLLGSFQYGYRSKRSTVTAVATMSSKARLEANKGNAVGMTMFDMSAAFDTVQKETVCEKLEHLAVSKQTIEWIRSYLENRKQQVKVGEEESAQKEIRLGTPQGSRLSPLLFNILTCDLGLYMKNGLVCNFADDTSNCVAGKTLEEVVEKLQSDAEGMIKFTSSNNLVINTEKTAFICKGEKGPTELQVGKDKVMSEKDTVLLGMTVSANLKWMEHTKKIKSSLKGALGALIGIRQKVPKYTLREIAEALFSSHLRSGIQVYCTPKLRREDDSNAILKTLTVMQNNMMRIVLGYKLKDRVSNERLRKELKMMSVNQLCTYHILVETYSILKNNTSEYIRKVLTQQPGVHAFTTRSRETQNVKVPVNEGQNNNFVYYAAALWNMLPEEIKVTDFRRKDSLETASSADSGYRTEKQVRIQAERMKVREARRFKGQVKKWIFENIPQE